MAHFIRFFSYVSEICVSNEKSISKALFINDESVKTDNTLKNIHQISTEHAQLKIISEVAQAMEIAHFLRTQ